MAKARSPKGSGSYDRCDGFFRWRIGIFDPTTGKNRYKSIKAKTQAAPEAKVKAWKEANGGELPPTERKRVLVRDFAEIWLKDIACRKEARTAVNYGMTARKYIIPKFGGMHLQKVTPLMLQSLFNSLSATLSPATVITIRVHFRVFFAAAGLTGARFHDLRHFFASSALARGVPIAAISEQLGHSSISVTFDVYSHVLRSSRDEPQEALEGSTLFSSGELSS